MTEPNRHRVDDYRITVDVWRQYVDARFNLLRLVPLATGIGVAFVGDEPSYASALVSAGALASIFGIVMYDLRNSVLHDATIHRARELEKLLGLDRVSGVPKDVSTGGAFTDRPGRRLTFMGIAGWHDRALNIIYSTSAAAWITLLAVSVLTEWAWPPTASDRWLVAGFLGLLGFALWFQAIARWDSHAGVDRKKMSLEPRHDRDRD